MKMNVKDILVMGAISVVSALALISCIKLIGVDFAAVKDAVQIVYFTASTVALCRKDKEDK